MFIKRFYELSLKKKILLLLALLFHPALAYSAISGVTGTTFELSVSQTNITTPDGDSVRIWGYGINGQPVQYPGPTLILNQGDTITVNLTNNLGIPEMPVSMVFPGHKISAAGGSAGLITQESSSSADQVSYTFVAESPGTYLYHSGTKPELQIEMGMMGAIVVRPANIDQAYNHIDTSFDHEYLFLLSEIDPNIHFLASLGLFDQIDNSSYNPVLWFINGRNAPDTLAPTGASYLPNQPYGSLARTHPGEKVLARIVNAGRDLHPFHFHGNHITQIARDGNLLSSASGAGPDLSRVDFTMQTVPGATYDAIWSWTGSKLGWDIYGHTDPTDLSTLEVGEYAPDHGKPIPVTLPVNQDSTYGQFYPGSPYLGQLGSLPTGEAELNMDAGMFFMWHSHAEKELVNNDIAPGGMMTMMIVEHPLVIIE